MSKSIVEPFTYRGYLIDFHFSRSLCLRTTTIILTLSESADSTSDNRSVQFDGVLECVVGDLNGIVYLDLSVIDIRYRQLEGICYSVSEQERGVFIFQCRAHGLLAND